MSQKVHPKGFRLGRQNSSAKRTIILQKDDNLIRSHSLNHPWNGRSAATVKTAWDSLWFSDPKKGKHFYTRLFQQDQLIQEYTTGFFRSFGFYQEKCIVERNCSQEIHVTSYVLRTPKLQRSKIDQLRSPKETPLKLGLEEGWIPTLILQTLGKIMMAWSLHDHHLSALNVHSRGNRFQPIIQRSDELPQTKVEKAPTISSIIRDGSESDILKYSTELKRFNSFWFNARPFHGQGSSDSGSQSSVSVERTTSGTDINHSTSGDHNRKEKAWWVHRSWQSTLCYPRSEHLSSLRGVVAAPSISVTDMDAENPSVVVQSGIRNGHEDSMFLLENIGNESSKDWSQGKRKSFGMDHAVGAPIKIIYSIKPTKSLISSSQLVADYIADKIEQSVSIQQIFNELLQFFETEAQCIGPAFKTDAFSPQSIEDLSKSTSKDERPTITDHSRRSNMPQNDHNEIHEADTTISEEAHDTLRVFGFKIYCSGRLQINSFSKPAEKAEKIEITRGVLPLNTVNANIDFAQTYATNAYGTCGIKVWINRG